MNNSLDIIELPPHVILRQVREEFRRREALTLPNACSSMNNNSKNLTKTLTDTINQFGLPDLLAQLAKQVLLIKNHSSDFPACILTDIANDLENASRKTATDEMTAVLTRFCGAPVVRVIVIDYSRDTSREYKFDILVSNANEILRTISQLDRAHADLTVSALRKRYEVSEVVENEWLPMNSLPND